MINILQATPSLCCFWTLYLCPSMPLLYNIILIYTFPLNSWNFMYTEHSKSHLIDKRFHFPSQVASQINMDNLTLSRTSSWDLITCLKIQRYIRFVLCFKKEKEIFKNRRCVQDEILCLWLELQNDFRNSWDDGVWSDQSAWWVFLHGSAIHCSSGRAALATPACRLC